MATARWRSGCGYDEEKRMVVAVVHSVVAMRVTSREGKGKRNGARVIRKGAVVLIKEKGEKRRLIKRQGTG